MTKILFICHGNICRSPMAEFIMKEIVKQNNVEKNFLILSAATSNEEIGNPVYPPVRRILNSRGIDCSKKRAVRVTRQDYENYDYLICMDKNNLRNLSYIIGEDIDKKVYRLLDFTDSPHDVADPWYTGDFDITLCDVQNGCNALFQYIQKKLLEFKEFESVDKVTTLLDRDAVRKNQKIFDCTPSPPKPPLHS